jgi:hypothetical protein
VLVDLSGNVQPPVGTAPHWAMFTALSAEPTLYGPMRAQLVQVVNDAIATNPARPYIDSRQAGARVLEALGSWWHGEFPRKFIAFPNGAERGIFGMALWNYLAGHPDRWCFSNIADSHGYGQDATQYWRL